MEAKKADWSKGNVVRQGDVLVINNAPKKANLKEVPREDGGVVLAYGEVTGHKHQFRDPCVALLSTEGVSDRVVSMSFDSILAHEEHTAISFPPGDYTVRVQCEWSDDEEAKQVQD